jgi:hypothetical protein
MSSNTDLLESACSSANGSLDSVPEWKLRSQFWYLSIQLLPLADVKKWSDIEENVSGIYFGYVDIVSYLLKARTVQPEKKPLLCNDRGRNGYTRPVSRQRLDNHVPAEKSNATVGL